MRDRTRALGSGRVLAPAAQQQGAAPPASPAPAQDNGQWTMPAKDYAATRFSALAEINAGNVKRLRAVWTFSSGVLGGHEGQPLVVNHTMYAVTPYPNVLYAFDLTREGYPLKWKYRPYVNPAAIGIACCDVINRGAFYADGKIVYNLLDGHTVAIDTATGKEVWKTQLAGGGVEARRRARVGVALVRSGAGPRLLRHGQPGAVQRGAAPGRQQVGDQRVGAPSRRRFARVGVSVHAGRQLGLRRGPGDDARRPHDQRPETQGPGSLRQERLRLDHRPRHGRGPGREAVRDRQLGEAGRSRDRSPGGRSHEADGRLTGDRQGHLPDARGREEPAAPRVIAPHLAVLRSHEQPVHGLRRRAGDVPRGDAVHRREHALQARAGRLARCLHR